MQFVRDSKIYDTEKSKHIHSAPTSTPLVGIPATRTNSLYRSAKGQYFTVVIDTFSQQAVEFMLLTTEGVTAWLEEFNAPPAAYKEVGILLEEG